MDQLFQIAGAVLILIAFMAAQRGTMSPHSAVYLSLNLVGSIVLTGVALHGEDWGFLLLEVVWAAVSAWGLVQVMRGGTPTAAH
jgi:CBS-domain-containing membrane protein